MKLTSDRVMLDFDEIDDQLRASAAQRGRSEGYLRLGIERIITQHVQRYFFAERFIARRRRALTILDAACGTGYGTYILAGRKRDTQRTAIGVDIDAPSIAHARAQFTRPGLSYRQADCLALPWDTPTFDLIASFETLEHFNQADGARFVQRLAAILRPGGLLVLSSPAPHSETAMATPFHHHEYTLAELETVLGAHFAHYCLFEQGYVAGSAILPVRSHIPHVERSSARERLDRRAPLRPSPVTFAPPGGVAPPPILRNHIAVCSHEPLPREIAPALSFFDLRAQVGPVST